MTDEDKKLYVDAGTPDAALIDQDKTISARH
jgi:hypothetical protein